MGSLAVTYFRTREVPIIGAVSFHGPCSEGKGGSETLWPPSITCPFVAGAANAKREEGGCDCVIELLS